MEAKIVSRSTMPKRGDYAKLLRSKIPEMEGKKDACICVALNEGESRIGVVSAWNHIVYGMEKKPRYRTERRGRIMLVWLWYE